MFYAIKDFGLELARLERGSSRRTTVMRYPTREYQSDSSSYGERGTRNGERRSLYLVLGSNSEFASVPTTLLWAGTTSVTRFGWITHDRRRVTAAPSRAAAPALLSARDQNAVRDGTAASGLEMRTAWDGGRPEILGRKWLLHTPP